MTFFLFSDKSIQENTNDDPAVDSVSISCVQEGSSKTCTQPQEKRRRLSGNIMSTSNDLVPNIPVYTGISDANVVVWIALHKNSILFKFYIWGCKKNMKEPNLYTRRKLAKQVVT